MSFHSINCPNCNASLEVEATEFTGGTVSPSVTVLGFEAPPEVKATPAAVAHADELGVPLEQVEGTGAGGNITKSDVAAAAAENPPAEEAPANA